MTDLSKRLRDAAIHRETVTPDEAGVRTLSASLDRAKALMVEAADALDNRWRPIAEAPEGPVLVFCPDELPHVVAAEFIVTDEWSGWAYCDTALADISPEGPSPTHFMALPAPPKQEGG